jgi:hypothetical protein
MHYLCSACHRPIGLMANKNGSPQQYWCPHAQRMAEPQMPVRRDTAPLKASKQLESESLQLMSRMRKEPDER